LTSESQFFFVNQLFQAGAKCVPKLTLRRKYPQAEREWRWQYAFPFAVDMRKRGYSVEQIQTLMGHKNEKTTQLHYLRSIEPDIDNLKGPLD
jgi:integrase